MWFCIILISKSFLSLYIVTTKRKCSAYTSSTKPSSFWGQTVLNILFPLFIYVFLLYSTIMKRVSESRTSGEISAQKKNRASNASNVISLESLQMAAASSGNSLEIQTVEFINTEDSSQIVHDDDGSVTLKICIYYFIYILFLLILGLLCSIYASSHNFFYCDCFKLFVLPVLKYCFCHAEGE